MKPSRFGRNFKRMLKEKNISQRDFCKQAGICSTTFNRILNGAQMPSFVQVCKMLQHSPKTFDQLMAPDAIDLSEMD